MLIASLVITLVGVAVSTAGSAWLIFGFSPTNPRYVDEGLLYPGPQTSTVVPNLITDQRRPLGLIAIGGGVQIVGGVVAVFATISG